MNIEEKFLSGIDIEKCKNFDCGENDISTMSSFLYEEAPMHQSEGTAFKKVFLDADNNDTIVGYYSLKASILLYRGNAPHGISETITYVIPAVEIARFALALPYQGFKNPETGRNVSTDLMEYALRDIMDLREYALGVKAVVLFSIDRIKQLRFYEKFGFKRFLFDSQEVFQSTENEGCIPLYLILPKVN